jgi:hypothetical protein
LPLPPACPFVGPAIDERQVADCAVNQLSS